MNFWRRLGGRSRRGEWPDGEGEEWWKRARIPLDERFEERFFPKSLEDRLFEMDPAKLGIELAKESLRKIGCSRTEVRMFINGAVSNHDSGYQTYAKGCGIMPQPFSS